MENQAAKAEFVKLVDENKGIIYKVCRTYCAQISERDDLAQEIVYNLWKSYKNYSPEYKFTTWMYRVALNVAISFYRQHRRREPISVSENLLFFEDNNSEENEENENIRQLHLFIDALNEIDKSIMLLYLEEKSYQEISDITGTTLTNVATRISRIKEKLKTAFQNLNNN